MKRRIFVGGLTHDNFKTPPEDSGLAFLKIGKGSQKIIRTEDITDDDINISEVHIYDPNNIVIVDYDWLLKNLNKIKNWHALHEGTLVTDITYLRKEES